MRSQTKIAMQGIVILTVVAACGWFVANRTLRQRRVNDELAMAAAQRLEAHARTAPAATIGHEQPPIALPLRQPTGLAVGPGGRLFVSGDHAIVILDAAGVIQHEIALEHAPGCVAVAPDGVVYAGLRDRIAVYDARGTALATWPSLGAKALVTDIAVTDDTVYIADAGTRIVHRFDRAGETLDRIGERNIERDIRGFVVPSPYFALAVAPLNKLWIVNPGRHALEHYTPDGVCVDRWAQIGMTDAGFSGCCNPTHIAIRSDSTVVTSEKNIVRVKLYSESGALIGVIAGPGAFDRGTVGLDLAVDQAGRILVLDPVRRQVRIFTLNLPAGELP